MVSTVTCPRLDNARTNILIILASKVGRILIVIVRLDLGPFYFKFALRLFEDSTRINPN